jgi:NAD(P)-dependent dehydrogenase (short-subunit alcohol dehydrogenase family)
MRLEGKHLVVIGGSSGIGLETAPLALSEGASVTIAGRSEERLQRAAETLGNAPAAGPTRGSVRAVKADVTDESSVRALFEGGSPVDHLFLPAGELQPGGGDVLAADLTGLRSILESRLLGAACAVRQARPRMTGGSITLMSGLYSQRPGRGGAFAAAAVAAVEGLTRALALDLAPTRVNAVAPGLIDTPLWDAFGPQRAAILAHGAALPVGRVGRPEEVAEGVLFLMCNGFVTGTVLSIDGGGSLV